MISYLETGCLYYQGYYVQTIIYQKSIKASYSDDGRLLSQSLILPCSSQPRSPFAHFQSTFSRENQIECELHVRVPVQATCLISIEQISFYLIVLSKQLRCEALSTARYFLRLAYTSLACIFILLSSIKSQMSFDTWLAGRMSESVKASTRKVQPSQNSPTICSKFPINQSRVQ